MYDMYKNGFIFYLIWQINLIWIHFVPVLNFQKSYPASVDFTGYCYAERRILCLLHRHTAWLNGISALSLRGRIRLTHVQPSDQAHPRILHAHQDHVEVLLICAGSANIRIEETVYEVHAGDLLVYNSGVVHDEISDYENALLPDGIPPVCPMEDEAEDLRQLYDMMYRRRIAEAQNLLFTTRLYVHSLRNRGGAADDGSSAGGAVRADYLCLYHL